MPKHEHGDRFRRQRSSNSGNAKRAGTSSKTENQSAARTAETNTPEFLGQAELNLQTTLREGRLHLQDVAGPRVPIDDILENYRKLRTLLDSLTLGELWPCLVTRSRNAPPFSAPLDVPPSLAARLVAQLRTMATGASAFPSAPAAIVQSAVSDTSSGELALAQPYFVGASQRLIALPKDNAEAGFVRGAKLDTDLRTTRLRSRSADQQEEPLQALVSVETAKPNITVVYTNGYFLSTLRQLGVSTPATGHLLFGLYRFGIEVKGFHVFQESLVSIPDQLRILLDLEPKD